MTDFVKVAKVSEIPDPGKKVLEVDGRFVVLVRIQDQFYCLDDVCTHDGGPLGEGALVDHSLSCPRHGARFDLRSGKALTMPATVDTLAHSVRVIGDDVFVQLGSE